jgi:dienelactone hydrolase
MDNAALSRKLVAEFLGTALLLALLVAQPISAMALDAGDVRFPSFDSDRTPIRGDLFKPAGAGPFAAVVMMHGCSGLYRKSGRMHINSAAWVERFVSWGYAVLAVDGFNPRGFRTMCAKSKRPLHSLDDRPFDAYGGLAWLSAQPFIRPGQIALVGWSNGAMATLSGLRKDEVKHFGGDFRFRAAAAFYPGCITLSKRIDGEYRPYAPLLVLVGLADDWTFPKPCIALMEGAKSAGFPVEIAAYEGAYHAFDHPNLKIRTRVAKNRRWKTRKERDVHIGSNPAARDASIRRLQGWLKRHIGG